MSSTLQTPSAEGAGMDDVAAMYRLLLGREAESDAVKQRRVGQTASELIREIVSSDEFDTHVVRAIVSTRMTPAWRFPAPPSPALKSWFLSFGDIRSDAEAMASAPNWPALLKAIFLNEDVRRLAPQLEDLLRAYPVLEALDAWAQNLPYERVTGAIEVAEPCRVSGWALDPQAPDDPVWLRVYCQGRLVGSCSTTRFRRDIQARFGGEGNNGFTCELSLKPKPEDLRPLELEIREAHSLRTLARAELQRHEPERIDQLVEIRTALAAIEAQILQIKASLPQAVRSASFALDDYDAYRRAFRTEGGGAGATASDVRFLILIDAYGCDGERFAASLESLIVQTHAGWRAVVSGPANDQPHTSARVAHVTSAGPLRGEALGAAIQGAGNDYVMVLSAGDLLERDALAVLCAHAETTPSVIFADEDAYEGEGHSRRFLAPKLRPDFDDIWMLQGDMVGAGVLLRIAALRQVLSERLQPVDSWAAMVFWTCMSAGPGDVAHARSVLLHRRSSSLPFDLEERGRLVADHLRRHALPAEVSAPSVTEPAGRQTLRLAPRLQSGVTASVIIPTHDRVDLLRLCMESLLASRLRNTVRFDIHVVAHRCEAAATLSYLSDLRAIRDVQVFEDQGPFNWAALNNRAAERCSSDVLIFLNDDTAVMAPDWCDELCMWAMQPSVGPVGARLLYGDGTIQHAGMVGGPFDSVTHEGVGEDEAAEGYLGRYRLAHRATAVTGACLAVRRELFNRLQGFDEVAFPVTFNDTDFCLRAGRLGCPPVYTPHASFLHFESQSRGFDSEGSPVEQRERHRERAAFVARWPNCIADDPNYNPRFDRWSRPFTRLRPYP